MLKARIIHIQNLDDVHRYVIPKKKDIHGLFCNFLSDLNFNNSEIEELDIIFDDLENDYIYISNPNFEIHFFITKEFVNLVIKSKMPQQKINKIMKKYFKFPDFRKLRID